MSISPEVDKYLALPFGPVPVAPRQTPVTASAPARRRRAPWYFSRSVWAIVVVALEGLAYYLVSTLP